MSKTKKQPKTAIIIGAGPAGLTAAFELLERTEIKPVIYEATDDIGGISKTVNYKGNRIDIGGHRFFSKSDRINKWWDNILPRQGVPSVYDVNRHRGSGSRILKSSYDINGPDPELADQVMLIRERLSRILFQGKFFDYPLTLDLATIKNLGVVRISKIALSYTRAKIMPVMPENSLEDFLVNRFGRELYRTFFASYTEKVWGVPCSEITAEWGAQRIKSLSLLRVLLNHLKLKFFRDYDPEQKKIETSLIEQFSYPKYGPGQMWEAVARRIQEKGGEIFTGHRVVGIDLQSKQNPGVTVKLSENGAVLSQTADYLFSTMPVKELIEAWEPSVPDEVLQIARGLAYRDFVMVGILLKKMSVTEGNGLQSGIGAYKDNWIYIQDEALRASRLQIFNNWSPYMVKDRNTIWLGMEYFCNEGDDLWSRSDSDMTRLAVEELQHIGFCRPHEVLDSTVLRVPKTYPAYFGSYHRFNRIRKFTDDYANLFLIGRNGMHRYNNMDHSMMTAMVAVDNVAAGNQDKANIWEVNTESEYHETKS
jgi:protoporphyrinogen oxidase